MRFLNQTRILYDFSAQQPLLSGLCQHLSDSRDWEQASPQSGSKFLKVVLNSITSGFEKYYQIAKCFRDEDLRADRQPEHTQLDFEMSFVHQEDVLSNCEELYYFLSQEYQSKDIEYPFPRITYQESIERYGTDKPDTRFSLELKNLNGILSGTEFRVFNNVLDSNGSIKGISLKNSGIGFAS